MKNITKNLLLIGLLSATIGCGESVNGGFANQFGMCSSVLASAATTSAINIATDTSSSSSSTMTNPLVITVTAADASGVRTAKTVNIGQKVTGESIKTQLAALMKKEKNNTWAVCGTRTETVMLPVCNQTGSCSLNEIQQIIKGMQYGEGT